MTPSQTLGKYTLHFDPLELREGERLVELTGRQLRVLELLVRAQGKVVPKQVFFDRIWRGLSVEDGNLTQTIFLLRKALGYLADGEEYIRTVPRKGYCVAKKALLPGHADAEPQLPSHAGEQNEAALALLVNSIQDYAIYTLDCAGRVVTWNRGAAAILGYTEDEVLGRHFSEFSVPEELETEAPRRYLDIASREGRWRGEGWRLRKSGARFWASSVLLALRSSSGQLVGFGEVLKDVSERKHMADAMLRMEAALRKERDRMRAAAESSRDALYICEPVRNQHGDVEDFVFTYLNSNVSKMVSIPTHVLLGGKMCELLPANLSLGLFEAYKRVFLTGEPFTTEVHLQERNVLTEWLLVQAVRFEDGIAITASDISRQKRTEDRLHAVSSDPVQTASPLIGQLTRANESLLARAEGGEKLLIENLNLHSLEDFEVTPT